MLLKALNYDFFWKNNGFVDTICPEDFKITKKTIIHKDTGNCLTIKKYMNNLQISFEKRSTNESLIKIHRNMFYQRTLTFESRKYPGYYIRHKNKKLIFEKFDDTELFKKDSSFITIEKNKIHTAWLCPYPISGSGGIRTLLRMAKHCASDPLQKVDLWIKIQPWETWDRSLIVKRIKEEYNAGFGIICLYRNSNDIPRIYHKIYCTNPYTAYDCNDIKLSSISPFNIPLFDKYTSGSGKIMFMQDTEWIEDFKANNVSVEWLLKAYDFDMSYITIGDYLKDILIYKFKKDQNRIKTVNFYVDTKLYINRNIERENAVCILYQPEKPRRDSKFIINLLNQLRNFDIMIYLYGSNESFIIQDNVKNLGLLNLDECVDLYNRCKVGFIVQNSNPSRIPYEMVSCGLKCISTSTNDIDLNKYDISDISKIVNKGDVDKKIIKYIKTYKPFSHLNVQDLKQERKEFKLRTKQYVSFDLFDTLITRNSDIKSSDCMLTEMDRMIKNIIPNFEKLRIESQCDLSNHVNDFDINDIYSNMNIEQSMKNYLIRTEIEIDMKFIYVIKAIYDFYNLIDGNIIISDMYYTLQMMKNILDNFDIRCDNLFVSSYYKINKYRGLFNIVLEKLDIFPEQLVHIGDNNEADYISPRRIGISSIILNTSYTDREANCDSSLRKLIRKLRLNTNLKKSDKGMMICDISTSIAAPLLYCYVEWCMLRAIDLKIYKLAFLARDGYIMYNIAKNIQNSGKFKDLNLMYMYNSRYATQPYTLNLNTTYMDIISGEHMWLIHCAEDIITRRIILNRLWLNGDEFDDIYDLDEKLDRIEIEQFIMFLMKNKWTKIIENIRSDKNSYTKRYMDNFMKTPIVLVDSGWFGNMIYSMRKLYPENKLIYGLFIKLFPNKHLFNNSNNISWLNNIERDIPVQQIVECFVSTDRGVFKGFTKTSPIFGLIEYEKINWGSRVQMNRIINACDKIIKENISFQLYTQEIINLFKDFCMNPTRIEAYVYGEFPYSSDQLDSHYKKLASEDCNDKNIPIWYPGYKALLK